MADVRISSIIAKVKQKGFFDPTRYEVFIMSPIGALGQDERLYCSSINLPGRGFSTVERYDHGPNRKISYAELYDDLPITFYCSEDLKEKEFFDKWQTFIGGENDYYLPYYDEIVGNLRITTIKRDGSIGKKINIIEAWPITVGEISMGYDQLNSISTFNVQMAYHHWEYI